jgi:amidase
MARAAELDETFAKTGPVGPLHGVPVTIKVNIDQTGRATTNGVAAFKDLIAPADSPFVTNLEQAGAVVIGRTNTPEFSMRGTTDNPLHGRTFNPWNDWASAGGSSGGASAAVMSGMGAIAHGNDILGSVRFPATCTGSSSIKPGLGRTPAYNPSQTAERGLLAQLMSVQGVMCREVGDVRLALQSAIAYSPLDPWQVPMPFAGPPADGPIRVGFTRETYGHDIDPAVEKALETARATLVDAGYVVEEIKTPDLSETYEDTLRALNGEFYAMMLDMIREHGSAEVNVYFDKLFEAAPPYKGDALLAAFARRSKHVRDWLGLLQDYPLVLTPFLLRTTYSHNADYENLDGLSRVLLSSLYSGSFNFMGLPAGNVPANANDGLPVGVQIVGQRFREDMILDACEAIEARVGVMAHQLFAREDAAD